MIKLDEKEIIEDYKKENPEYANKEIYIKSYENSYSVMKKNPKRKDELLLSVTLDEDIDYGPYTYGYIRVSSKGQAKDGNSLEAQEKAVRDAGARYIYTDVYTGTTTDRPELDKLLEEIDDGDTLIVTKLDRISRSVQQGISLIDNLLERGISVHVLNMGMMDDTPTGKLIRNIMLSFAEFERDMIMQRTREGKETSGNFGGRKCKYTEKELRHAVELLKHNSYKQVLTMIPGMSKSTLQRAKKKYG